MRSAAEVSVSISFSRPARWAKSSEVVGPCFTGNSFCKREELLLDLGEASGVGLDPLGVRSTERSGRVGQLGARRLEGSRDGRQRRVQLGDGREVAAERAQLIAHGALPLVEPLGCATGDLAQPPRVPQTPPLVLQLGLFAHGRIELLDLAELIRQRSPRARCARPLPRGFRPAPGSSTPGSASTCSASASRAAPSRPKAVQVFHVRGRIRKADASRAARRRRTGPRRDRPAEPRRVHRRSRSRRRDSGSLDLRSPKADLTAPRGRPSLRSLLRLLLRFAGQESSEPPPRLARPCGRPALLSPPRTRTAPPRLPTSRQYGIPGLDLEERLDLARPAPPRTMSGRALPPEDQREGV